MVFTNKGVELIADFLAGNSPTQPTHMAVGSGSVDPNADDTALGSELYRVSVEEVTDVITRVRFSFILLSTQQNGENLRECGLFNAATDGDMYSRFTHGTIVKSNSYEVEYTITLEITNS